MTQQRLIIDADLGEFFRSQVADARQELGVNLTDMTEYYLVNLLCEFSKPGGPAPKPGDEPLALIYKRALEAEPVQRVKLLKNLGDVALYVAGFFAEFVERSLVDVDYYISMGGGAYSNLSDLVAAQRQGETFAELYLQLARQFATLVDLFSEIAERANAAPSNDETLLRLYNRWARTGSSRIRRVLCEKGLIPVDDLPTEYVQ